MSDLASQSPSVITILMLSAQPQGKPDRRLDKECQEITAGLERSQFRDRFRFISKPAVRPRDFLRAMLECNPQIVHFAGQGNAKQGLAFEDERGLSQFVEAAALAGTFKLFADRLQCVVLNACYSATQTEAIAQHIPFVVGMDGDIEPQTAIEFAVGFYDALGAGRTIDFAHQIGCSAIQLAGMPEHLVPVLQQQTQASAASTTAPLWFSPAPYASVVLPALRGLESESLLELLKPVELQIQTSTRQAYRLCRPEAWLAPEPRTIEEMLKDLQTMADGQTGHRAIHRFAGLLIVNPTLPKSIQQALTTWIEHYHSNSQALLDWAQQTLMTTLQEQPTDEPYLLIQIQKSMQESSSELVYVRMDAWLITDDRAYDSRTGTGSQQLSTPDQPILFNRDQPQEIEREIKAVLDQVCQEAINPEKLTLEIFVPTDLLSHSVDQWEPPDEYGFSLSLGKEYKVVIRSNDRLAENYRYKGVWQAKWEKLKQVETAQTCQALTFGQQPPTQALLMQLMQPNAVGVRFSRPLQIGSGGELALIHRTGLPLAFWLRQEQPATESCDPVDADCQQACKMDCLTDCTEAALGCALHKLPEQVRAKRRSNDAIANHLALLWEDFKRVPPTTSNPLSGAKL